MNSEERSRSSDFFNVTVLDMQICAMARRDIPSGEELTHPYTAAVRVCLTQHRLVLPNVGRRERHSCV